MKSVLSNFEMCTGCGACSFACVVNAVEMQRDSEGFLYAVVNEEHCITCGQCLSVCPLLRADKEKVSARLEAFSARNRNIDTLMESASGGVFTALSDEVLRKGGGVCGAVFHTDFSVHHVCAVNEEGRNQMRNSKYVQSEMGEIYAAVERKLQDGKLVLFTGTPCQTAGIKVLFGDSENLLLCDVLCYGVPSPSVWADYCKVLEKETGAPLKTIAFRTKADGWKKGKNRVYFRTYHDNEIHADNRFHELLFSNPLILRPSCYACLFADCSRPADLTIGDCWDFDECPSSWNDKRGISLVLAHSKKGLKFLQECEQLEMIPYPVEKAITMQKRLTESAKRPPDRDAFWKLFIEKGFATAYDAAKKKGEMP